MEKTLGISTKTKKTKVPKDPNQRIKRKRIPKKSITIQQTDEENPPNYNSTSSIKDKIKNWIYYGKKWLGF